MEYDVHEIIRAEIEDFLKRMGWPVNTTTDEARVKWKTAVKFLTPSKFEVTRAINLYRDHENSRKAENLDRIWINNPHLIREIQTNKVFFLRKLPDQPLTIGFKAAQMTDSTTNGSLSQQDRELITQQALICQLDVATESLEVQENGLNFIYDMQNCSGSQFDINLSKKILKLLHGNYPIMVKNTYVIAAPKWFKTSYKVSMYTPEQMRDVLTTHSGYSLDDIPISLGGTHDPTLDNDNRFQECLSTVTNCQSICYPYYSQDHQPVTAKSTSNIIFFNPDHHYHHHHHHPHQSQDTTSALVTTTSSPTSLVAIVALRRNHDSSLTQVRVRKRESSSSSSDSDKRLRSNESLIEEEPPTRNSLTYIPHENSFDRIQLKPPSVLDESVYFSLANNQGNAEDQRKNSMSESENYEHGVLKREIKRTTNTLYKRLNPTEYLALTPTEIRQEFRKLPNPPANDTRAAKDEQNVDKSRYRDVLPGEATRVKLQPDDDDENSDFINANYVSGHNNQEKAYIFTQGPLQTTVKDFWRMVWQENIAIIVMTTRVRESGTMKCFPYWPTHAKDVFNAGSYQIQHEKTEKFESFVITTLILRKQNNPEQRIVYHAHYLKWPDHGIPSNTKDALLFLETVEYYRQLTRTKAPVLLHCSAGIGRTGTFCAIDIGIKRYLEKNIIDMPSTVFKMRSERAGSVQTEDQYLFAHLALMDYIRQQQALHERINVPSQLSQADLTNKSDDTKIKDNHGSNETEDNIRKVSRLKTHKNKSNDLQQTHSGRLTNPGKVSNLQVSPTYRGKTLSDSSGSAVQNLRSSTTLTQNVPSRQRSITEQSSSISATTNNVQHKKARK